MTGAQLQDLEERLETADLPSMYGRGEYDPAEYCLRVAREEPVSPEITTEVNPVGPPELNGPAAIVRRLRLAVESYGGVASEGSIGIPDGYRALVEGEFVEEGDLRVHWGVWVYVDHTKRYGAHPATTATFGGPVIRECPVETFMHGEQEALIRE